MAKIVLAGPANDPYFPRCELLADQLKSTLPNFEIHKIFVQPPEWEEWLQNTCSKFGWTRSRENKAPIIWRELVSRGGKATLIGDPNDFQEFCRTYYGLRSALVTNYMLRVATENQTWTNVRDAEELNWENTQNPVVISIWNAAAETAQMIMGRIAKGGILPYDDMEFRLAAAPWMLAPASRPSHGDASDSLHPRANSSLESIIGDSSSFVEQLAALEGIQANIEDMACETIRRVINCGGNAISCAVGAKLVIIVIDESCNNDSSVESFRVIGRDLENTLANFKEPQSKNMNANVRVLFVAGGVECMNRTIFRIASNFVAGILSTVTDEVDIDPSSIDYETLKKHRFAVDPANVLCLTTPLENAAKSLVAKQLNVTTSNIHNLIIWSRPEEHQTIFPWQFYVDLSQATIAEHRGAIEGPAPFTRTVLELLAHERKFIAGINDAVSARYIVAAGKMLSVTSATTDFLRGWFGGAEKHPNFLVEQHMRNLLFSVGICKFSIAGNFTFLNPPLVEGLTLEPPKAPESIACFKSVPIRFTGRDNLDGTGYFVMQDISPPAEMFVVPQAKPVEEANPPVEEPAPPADTAHTGEAGKEIPSVDEGAAEDGGAPVAPTEGGDTTQAQPVVDPDDQPLLN